MARNQELGQPPEPVRRDAHPSETMLRHVVAVTEPQQAMDVVHRQRLAAFNLLVRRFIIQYRYGCLEPRCNTPTCYSCVKHRSITPPRRPTVITARAIAYHLASQDSPYASLCNNTPSVSAYDMKPTTALLEELGSEEIKNGFLPLSTWWKSENDKRNRFDTDSFAQSLFRTDAAKLADSLPISPLRHGDPTVQSITGASMRELHTAASDATANGSTASAPQIQQQKPKVSTEAQAKEHSEGINFPEHPKPSSPTLSSSNTDGSDTPHRQNQLNVKGRLGGYKITLSGDETRLPSANKSPAERLMPSKDPPLPGGKEEAHTRPKAHSEYYTTPLTIEGMAALKESLKLHKPHQMRVDEAPSIIPSSITGHGVVRFVNESLFQNLSDSTLLLRSFREEMPRLEYFESMRAALDASDWRPLNGSLIFDSLWYALGDLFVPPPGVNARRIKRALPSASASPFPRGQSDYHTPKGGYVTEKDAAHIIMVCMSALYASVPTIWYECANAFLTFGRLRATGFLYGDAYKKNPSMNPEYVEMTDALEYEPALRLADRLVRVIAARRCFISINQANLDATSDDPPQQEPSVMVYVIRELKASGLLLPISDDESREKPLSITEVFCEWLRALVIKKWTGEHEIRRWDVVGAAMEIMEDIHDANPIRDPLVKDSGLFVTQWIADKVDTVELITSYTNRTDNPNVRHLLTYTCLFPDDTLVSYFRALNFATMSQVFSTAGNNYHLQAKFRSNVLSRQWIGFLDDHYSVATSRYLILDIRRSRVLEDTLDQLWGLEKRQLLRPLKVRMGVMEGERGIDQGGVAQEFFRVALAEAFNPDNGMFTIDPTTRMTWFQPLSPAPLAHFTLLGLLFSLAIYNGITLPVTFPLALYEQLLSRPISSIDITDGWSDLSRSFNYLLTTTDDVAETLCRTYEYSFQARGLTWHINMASPNTSLPNPATVLDQNPATRAKRTDIHWPTPRTSDDEAPLVTNANRAQYVADYTHWLVHDAVAPQLAAFKRGFDTCIPPSTLAVLPPELLRSVAEGATTVDTHALQRAARYEGGFSASHPFVRMFWDVVHGYSNDDKRRLLEFVTASDRVPVQGIEKVAFWVQRNGPDTEALPTSSTCFGRLLVPEYEGEEKLRRKLGIALDNARGFGAA